jgi:hypothetical protein
VRSAAAESWDLHQPNLRRLFQIEKAVRLLGVSISSFEQGKQTLPSALAFAGSSLSGYFIALVEYANGTDRPGNHIGPIFSSPWQYQGGECLLETLVTIEPTPNRDRCPPVW